MSQNKISYSTERDLSDDRIIASIDIHIQNLCHLEVDLPILTTMIREDATLALVTRGKGAIHMGTMKNNLEGSSCNSYMRV